MKIQLGNSRIEREKLTLISHVEANFGEKLAAVERKCMSGLAQVLTLYHYYQPSNGEW